MVLRLKKLAARSGSSAALYRFVGHILLSVLSGNTCVLPTLSKRKHGAGRKNQVCCWPHIMLRDLLTQI
jgi:hypothetical protein